MLVGVEEVVDVLLGVVVVDVVDVVSVASWMPTIRGQVASTVQATLKPYCAPPCE